MKTSSSLLLLSLGFVAVLSGCLTKPYMREETAQRLAAPAWMQERLVPSTPFALKARERIHERHDVAHVYIEGDGVVEGDLRTDSGDPTPRNPVALHLATRDLADNVIHLARPFQYRYDLAQDDLQPVYWNNKRFAPEVLDSYNSALDEIKQRWNITGFHLTGYDGGGAIAALLAVSRPDVLSLRTVAGNLDTIEYTNQHGMAPLDGSLNPTSVAPELAGMPQCHYIGGQDEVMPPAVLHSYLQALGPTNCARYEMIQEASHTEGWVDKWPGILDTPCSCRGPVMDADMVMMPAPEPVFTPREMPVKP